MGFSLPHILIFVAVGTLLLGGGRISGLMGDVAKGVKNFKKGMADEDETSGLGSVAPVASLAALTAADVIAKHEAIKAREASVA